MPARRTLTIIAQDPSIKDPITTGVLRAQVSIPYESTDPGPRGYRVHVVDYDATKGVMYRQAPALGEADLFAGASDQTLLEDPRFHAQNVYAIVMQILARFEAALGRRVSWGFNAHQIHVVPHAFADVNAYYSDDAMGLFFGYFLNDKGEPIFTSLSHDIVAHETTHALLDGFRESYMLPSHPDQAAFHEAFADIVALLSVFGLPDVLTSLLSKDYGKTGMIPTKYLTADAIKNSVLLGLAEQFGYEASRHRDDCLRRAVKEKPDLCARESERYEESHARSEILSASVLNAFVEVWVRRITSWIPPDATRVSASRVIEDGADAAEQLLSMCIRALDYCPVVDLTFGDFLSAILTADAELFRDDKHKYREALLEKFKEWGIEPSSNPPPPKPLNTPGPWGLWEKPLFAQPPSYEGVHRESMENNPDEVFKFLWNNRQQLGIYEKAFTRVLSVRPCIRVAPDGFVLRETVCEYRQTLDITAAELGGIDKAMTKPPKMPDATKVRLFGGGVMLFDEFGNLKYHIRSRIDNAARQNARLEYLWKNELKSRDGSYGVSDGSSKGMRLAMMHNRRDGNPAGLRRNDAGWSTTPEEDAE